MTLKIMICTYSFNRRVSKENFNHYYLCMAFPKSKYVDGFVLFIMKTQRLIFLLFFIKNLQCWLKDFIFCKSENIKKHPPVRWMFSLYPYTFISFIDYLEM